ncbi:MAG: hypothetical protein HY762_06905 [Planctomycetes bacterium]|nr:hypothetical protein [Planctomycetota bacterium]
MIVKKGSKRELFGAVAVRLGFTKRQKVNRALKRQKELREKKQKHKLIGLIMLELGILDTAQLIRVLKEMELKQHCINN